MRGSVYAPISPLNSYINLTFNINNTYFIFYFHIVNYNHFGGAGYIKINSGCWAIHSKNTLISYVSDFRLSWPQLKLSVRAKANPTYAALNIDYFPNYI